MPASAKIIRAGRQCVWCNAGVAGTLSKMLATLHFVTYILFTHISHNFYELYCNQPATGVEIKSVAGMFELKQHVRPDFSIRPQARLEGEV